MQHKTTWSGSESHWQHTLTQTVLVKKTQGSVWCTFLTYFILLKINEDYDSHRETWLQKQWLLSGLHNTSSQKQWLRYSTDISTYKISQMNLQTGISSQYEHFLSMWSSFHISEDQINFWVAETKVGKQRNKNSTCLTKKEITITFFPHYIISTSIKYKTAKLACKDEKKEDGRGRWLWDTAKRDRLNTEHRTVITILLIPA